MKYYTANVGCKTASMSMLTFLMKIFILKQPTCDSICLLPYVIHVKMWKCFQILPFHFNVEFRKKLKWKLHVYNFSYSTLGKNIYRKDKYHHKFYTK